MQSVKWENNLFNIIQTTIIPISELNASKDSDHKMAMQKLMQRFILSVLRSEILPAFDAENNNPLMQRLIDRVRLEHPPFSLVRPPTLISEFATYVIPCLVTYCKTFSTLPDKLVFSMAAMRLVYKNFFRNNGNKLIRFPFGDIMNLMDKVWKTIPDGKSADGQISVSIILSYESHWKQDLSKLEGLTTAVATALKGLEKLDFDTNLKKTVHFNYMPNNFK